MRIQTKICGLSTKETVNAAINARADYLGFVFYPPSPRNISIEKAAQLAAIVNDEALLIGVFVNPNDALIASVLRNVDLDIIQLHGNESVERVQYLQKRFSKIIMKAISVGSIGDISRAREYEKIVDMLLFDAKAPISMDEALPGGNGIEFDWNLIAGYEWRVPWMLSGGLSDKNVREAIDISGAKTVDVSSGVESTPGIKDIEKINSFIAATQENKNE